MVEFAKFMLRCVFRLLYRVEVKGLEHLRVLPARTLIICNHVSLLDPPLLAAFLPGRPMFAIHSEVAKWWCVKPWLRLVDVFPLDPSNALATKTLIRAIEGGRTCFIFPEGRLSETGGLMKLYEGPGLVIEKTGAAVAAVHIEGSQYTPFTRLKGKVPHRLFPKITLTILPPRKLQKDITRKDVTLHLHGLMEAAQLASRKTSSTLYQALQKARRLYGGRQIVAEDADRNVLSYAGLSRGAHLLGHALERLSSLQENVGILLPTANATLVTFFALQAAGRVPAMLNVLMGSEVLNECCKAACIKTIITSRRFIEAASLSETVSQLKAGIIYLEDVRKTIKPLDIVKRLPPAAMAGTPAVILFTSGSEGAPKAVVLSHSNILSNIDQLVVRVAFNLQDSVFNALPLFHSFGLTAGMLLPVLQGIKTNLHPTPLHYRLIPERIYETNATMMFATDTFLNGYARHAHPYDFRNVRMIFAGAEKLHEATRRLYADRFGVTVFQGYGVTETSPVIAVNTALHHKPGTVGRMLSGIEARLHPVEGISEGGRLSVRGPNRMMGYYLAQKPGILAMPEQEWYDTGDIVSLDAEGYVTILGRAKRFAKIGGEMVSLAAVEALAQTTWPDAQHAALAASDDKKGEHIILVTTQYDADHDMLLQQARLQDLPPLMVPRVIKVIETMPLLATGKTDFATLAKRFCF